MSNEIYITFSGQTLSIAAWARKYGMHKDTLAKRLRRGMSLKDALFAPTTRGKPIKTPAGERTVKQVAKVLKVCVGTIYSRRRRGWAQEELTAKPMKRTKLTAFGKAKTVREWTIETGLSRDTIHTRLSKGWSPEEALSTPPFSNGYSRHIPKLTAFGKTLTLRQWADERNINLGTLRRRLRSGMPLEVALTAKVQSKEKRND